MQILISAIEVDQLMQMNYLRIHLDPYFIRGCSLGIN